MPGVRIFVENDVSLVADLIWKVLHNREGASPEPLKSYVCKLFLRNPWLEGGSCSRVYDDSQGRIVGFFGVVPRKMSLQGKTIRVALGSNFVLEPGTRTSMAAIQLVKSFMKGDQDLSMTDSANEMSRQLLRSLGFQVVPVYSLEWARPLRPFRYSLHALSRLKKSKAAARIGTVTAPLTGLADLIATKVKLSPFRQSPPSLSGQDLDVPTLLQCLAQVPKHWLVPEYNEQTLRWVLDFVSERQAFGNVRKILLRDKVGKAVGWYIYYVAPGAIGEVIQIGAEGYSIGAVLDHLFYDAWKHGLVGLHGRMEPQFMQELTMKSSFFLRHGSWTLVHSNRPELLGMVQSGTAFFSRLDGEWCFRYGGDDH